MPAPKEVIPTIEDNYIMNTGSHDHCVHVYSRTSVITIIRTMNILYITISRIMITMASPSCTFLYFTVRTWRKATDLLYREY